MTQLPAEESQPEPKKAKRNSHLILSFSEEDKIRTTQLHDNAMLITLRIGGYDVKRVMVDGGWWQHCRDYVPRALQGGLKLKPEDLMPYGSPLISFDRKPVIPKGMIKQPIQTGPKIVEVNFIVGDTYSLYIAVVGRP